MGKCRQYHFLDSHGDPWGFVPLLSWPAIVAILLSTLIALVAGIRGFVNKAKLDERGAGQCVIGIFVGGVNALVICLLVVVIYGMANSNFW